MRVFERIISLLLVPAVLLLICASCTDSDVNKDTKAQEEIPEPTDKLVIYDAPLQTDFLRNAIAIFKQKFPGVEVEFREFGSFNLMNPDAWSNIQSYQETLPAELATGRGPDILVWSDDYSPIADLSKTVLSGIFTDLNTYIDNDDSFMLEGLNKNVLDSGVFGGNRYVMPLFYNSNIWMTTEEVLDENDIALEELQDFPDAAGHMGEYIVKNQNTNRTVFYQPYGGWTGMILNSGLSFVDYEQGIPKVDGDDFRIAMETYKILYEHEDSMGNLHTTNTDTPLVNLINKESLFDEFSSNTMLMQISAYSKLSYTQTPVMMRSPTFNGLAIGTVDSYGAVLENSDNKVNAYEFLKILLSDEVQSDYNLSHVIPVLHTALQSKANIIVSRVTPKEGEDGATGQGLYGSDPRLIPMAISEENIEKYVQMLWDVDVCINVSPVVFSLVFSTMNPFLVSERSYEDCLAELTTALTLYLHE